jgi:hypothetical protein
MRAALGRIGAVRVAGLHLLAHLNNMHLSIQPSNRTPCPIHFASFIAKWAGNHKLFKAGSIVAQFPCYQLPTGRLSSRRDEPKIAQDGP